MSSAPAWRGIIFRRCLLNEKPWYKSKLFWLGVLQVVIASLQLLSQLLQQASVTPSDVTLFASGVLTIIFRVFFTDSKLV
jgi:hypothetical protein